MYFINPKEKMQIVGKNKDVKAFLKDLPVQPNERVCDFVNTFSGCAELVNAVGLLYGTQVFFQNKEKEHGTIQ